MKKIILLTILLLILPTVTATGYMKLLAVKEQAGNYTGSPADLYLEIKPGSGRVYLETFPLTKLDTQLSTRFAKEIACSYLNFDCSRYDFFYAIRAESTIVGGPSAGAATAILTITELSDLELDETMTITGTINSGGFIGAVGGLKAKIDAASQIGLTKVLIPAGEDNLTGYGSEKGIEVIEVSSLRDAVFRFTGQEQAALAENITIDPTYKSVMRNIAAMLCNKSNSLIEKTQGMNNTEGADNLTGKGNLALSEERDYSAASYCFGANVKYRNLLLGNLSKEKIQEKAGEVENEISKFIVPDEINTITDLQTYMIVKNRIADALNYLNYSLEENNTQAVYDLAYAIERFYTAESWSSFFGKGGKEIELNQDMLRQGCISKISEAEERAQYSKIYLPIQTNDLGELIDEAKKYLMNKEYAVCLFEASKAKASANIILSLTGIKDEDDIKRVVELKLEILRENINKQIEPGMFPILGYSYYEYANSLKESDPSAALLYSEYALEFSNLDIYFREKDVGIKELSSRKLEKLDYGLIIAFIAGLLIGVILTRVIKLRR